MESLPRFFGVLLMLLIQGIRGLMMRLVVGMVGIGGAIIIEGNGLGHTCQGPGADNFGQLYLSTMMRAMELVLRDTCEIILEG